MTSFKSKIFNFLLRNRHLFQGKYKKEVFDFNTSIADFREQCEKGASKYAKIPKEITVKEQLIEGIKSEWLIPNGADSKKVILYVHVIGYQVVSFILLFVVSILATFMGIGPILLASTLSATVWNYHI